MSDASARNFSEESQDFEQFIPVLADVVVKKRSSQTAILSRLSLRISAVLGQNVTPYSPQIIHLEGTWTRYDRYAVIPSKTHAACLILQGSPRPGQDGPESTRQLRSWWRAEPWYPMPAGAAAGGWATAM